MQTKTWRTQMSKARRAWAALVLVGVGCLALSCTHTTSAQGDAGGQTRSTETEAAGRFYTVQPGDSLWAIAQANGISVEELAEVNGVEAPESIRPGTRLFLPGVAQVTPPSRATASASVEAPDAKELETRLQAQKAPFDWPLEEGIIIRDFAPSSEIPLDGILLAAPRGTPVLAAAAGQVLFAGTDKNELGTLVILRHSEEWLTIYGHLEETHLVAGASVRRGQQIGRVGESGGQESPLLHFQVRSGRQPVDPLRQLPPP